MGSISTVKTVAFVAADGHDSDESDVLEPIHGDALLTHAVRGLFDSGCVDLVIVTVSARRVVACTEALRDFPADRCRVLAGEATRAGSLRTALTSTNSDAGDAGDAGNNAPVFLVHDPRCAFTPPQVVRAVTEAVLAGAPAVVPVLPVTDTVKLVGPDGVITGTSDRELLRTAQSPLGFPAPVLHELLSDTAASEDTATGWDLARDTDLLERLHEPAHTVAGHPDAMRLSTRFDLALAGAARSVGELSTKEAR